MKMIRNADMSTLTSFKAGGTADIILPDSLEDLQGVLAGYHEKNWDFIFLGNGTDTLFRDGHTDTSVIKLGSSFSDIIISGNRILCGAGALMSQAANAALNAGLSGLENISGIPGSVGGAVFMNAGAYGTEMKDVLLAAEIVSRDGSEVKAVPVEELDMSYRHSILQESGDIVTSVVFDLTPGDRREIALRMRDMSRKRASKQPLSYPSCGSFFKRPEGYYAGKLIEDSGLKGLSVGGAQVSVKHAGFLINRGGATARDVIDLMHLVQNTVKNRFGVELEPEVRIV